MGQPSAALARRHRLGQAAWVAMPIVAFLSGFCDAQAQETLTLPSCAAGKPQSCQKLGQGTCRKMNSLPNPKTACDEWVEACVDCQAAIAYCFERSPEPVFQGSAECTACKAEMEACMAAIDKQYWPNR